MIDKIDQKEALRVAYRYTKNVSRAEDLLSDTVVKALENVDKFDGKNPRAWFYRLMRNHYLNAFRRAKMAESHDIPDWGQDRPIEQDNLVGLRELASRINDLPQAYREVVNLRAADMSYDEIAASLNIPIGSVMSRLHRARAVMAV